MTGVTVCYLSDLSVCYLSDSWVIIGTVIVGVNVLSKWVWVMGVYGSLCESLEWLWITVVTVVESLVWMWVIGVNVSHKSDCESSEWSLESMWVIKVSRSHWSECVWVTKSEWVTGVNVSKPSYPVIRLTESSKWSSGWMWVIKMIEPLEWMQIIRMTKSSELNVNHQNGYDSSGLIWVIWVDMSHRSGCESLELMWVIRVEWVIVSHWRENELPQWTWVVEVIIDLNVSHQCKSWVSEVNVSQ